MNIYVGNLDFKVKENNLGDLFAEYGDVSSVKLITDQFSGRSKGFGFVVMDNDAEAKAAITALNGKMVNNRELVVNEARPQTRSNYR
ncbi:MAG: RNA-binding protein [Bacteroidales bacterium]|nr:RNA-binding protein [Bacteroidales bacterium]